MEIRRLNPHDINDIGVRLYWRGGP